MQKIIPKSLNGLLGISPRTEIDRISSCKLSQIKDLLLFFYRQQKNVLRNTKKRESF